MKFLGFLLSFLGALSLFVSHTNQNLLPQKLPALFKGIGILGMILGLIALLVSFPKLVACFIWIISIMFIWSFVPFLPLFKKEPK